MSAPQQKSSLCLWTNCAYHWPDKKLSYRRDSERQRSSRCSKSFCRQYGSIILNHFCIIVPKASELGRVTQNNGHTPFKVIQGHRFWCRSIRKRILLTNTNLYPVSHRFQVIADYWSNFRCR